MPFDQKKINGPDGSFSYRQLQSYRDTEKPDVIVASKPKEDSKSALELNVITKAKGSCYLEKGGTKVICAVFELRERRTNKYTDKGQLYIDFRYAPFARKLRKSVGDNEEKLMMSNIKTGLESAVVSYEFANYQIDVFVLVLEDDGFVLSASITAAGMALINASIPCFDMITSSSLELSSNNAKEKKDKKKKGDHGVCSLSSLSSIGQITQVMFKGFSDPSTIKKAKDRLHELNKASSIIYKKAVSVDVLK